MENKRTMKETALKMVALWFASSTVFEIPYLSWTFYDPMKAAFELTNLQMGSLMTVYGVAALASRFPGGWLADMLPERILLTISLTITGILGLFLLFHPPYTMLLIIWALMGISAVLPMWAAIIKATRQLGDSNVQGRLFGILESGRSLVPMLYCFGVIALFNFALTKVGTEEKALNFGIVALCCLMFFSALLIWVAFKPEKREAASLKEQATVVKWSEIKFVLRLPGVWLLALIIFSSYLVYICLSFITPYTTEIYGASTSTAAVLATIRTYGIGIFGAMIAGFIADKAGSTTKVIAISFVLIAGLLMSFFLAPVDKGFLWLVIVLMLLVAFVVFIPRGIYFAVIDEIGIPIKYTGAAVGVASFIGYSPDMFAYAVVGNWLDRYPGISGFHHAFVFMAGVSLAGFVFAAMLYRHIKKKAAE
ncbi:MFS transporter [Hominibacterium faecale]|nr:MFS transporter [Hominibacterium faecale]